MSKYESLESILNDEKLRNRLQSFIDEGVACRQKALDNSQLYKSIKDVCTEELKINPANFNFLVKTFFKNSFGMQRDQLFEQASAIDKIMKINGIEQSDE